MTTPPRDMTPFSFQLLTAYSSSGRYVALQVPPLSLVECWWPSLVEVPISVMGSGMKQSRHIQMAAFSLFSHYLVLIFSSAPWRVLRIHLSLPSSCYCVTFPTTPLPFEHSYPSAQRTMQQYDPFATKAVQSHYASPQSLAR